MTTPAKRDFLITVSTESPDGEIAAQLRGKVQMFVNEAVAIIGNSDGRVNISLHSTGTQEND